MSKWIKGILLLAVLLVVPSLARGQTAVSGNLRDLGLNNITSTNTFVQFQLQNFGSNIPRVTGTNVIVSDISPPFKPDGSGNISGNIQGNDTITPVNTYYRVCIFFKGQPFRCANYLITGGTFNLNYATPINPIPSPYVPNVVLLNPQASQNIVQPAGTVFSVNSFPFVPLTTVGPTGGKCIQDFLSGGIISFVETTTACGAGGGGSTPGGSSPQLQANIGGVFAGLNVTTDTGKGSLFIQGPIPWRDVRAYGATGDGSTDDTAAFNAAIDAAIADPAGTVYIPWTANAYRLAGALHANNTGFWLNFIQAGSISTEVAIAPGSFTQWTGIGGTSPTAFQFQSAAGITGVGNISVFSIVAKQLVVLKNLKVIPPGAQTTTHTIQVISSGATGCANITLDHIYTSSHGTGDPLHWDNQSAGGGFGGYIYGGAYSAASANTNHASIYIRDTGIMTVSPDFLGGYAIRIVDDLDTGGALNIVIGGQPNPMTTEALLDDLLILDNPSGNNGITRIWMQHVLNADVVVGGLYALRAIGAGSGAMGNIYLADIQGTIGTLNPSSTRTLVGVYPQGSGGSIPSGNSGAIVNNALTSYWADTTSHSALNVARGYIAAGFSQTGNTVDTHHFVHPVDGGVGTSFSSIDAHTIVRFDSANANPVLLFEGATNAAQLFNWTTSGGAASLFHKSSEHTYRVQVTGGTATSGLTLYGTTAGGYPAAPFVQFPGSLVIANPTGTTNYLQLTGTPTGSRTATFQDASGTVPYLGTVQTWSANQSFNSGKFLLNGSGSGSTTVNASATASGVVTIPAATDTLVGKATSDIFTNKTFDTAGAGNVLKFNSVTVTAFTGSAVLDFGSLAAIGCEDLTINVSGASVGDTVALGVPNGSVPSATFWFSAWVSSSGVVTVRGCTLVSGDPASGTFKATVIHF